MKKILNVITSLLLSVIIANPAPVPVFADDTTEIPVGQFDGQVLREINRPVTYLNTHEFMRWRLRFGENKKPQSQIYEPNIYMLLYRRFDSMRFDTLFFTFSDPANYENASSWCVYLEYSSDGEVWNSGGASSVNLSRWSYYLTSDKENGVYVPRRPVWYTVASGFDQVEKSFYPAYIPKLYLPLTDEQGYTGGYSTILRALSRTDGGELKSMYFSTSTGGRHFKNGDTLDDKETKTYNYTYNLMDVDNDNSVTLNEVQNYNSTYNADYTFSTINNNTDFTDYNFLYYIANNATSEDPDPAPTPTPGTDPVPGGGSSSGSGGSQQQQQQQTIEDGAVSVTVNNNNQLSQDQSSWIDSTINNWNGSTEEQQQAFDVGIGSIKQFTAVARAFSGLIGAFFGFLPSWALTISGVVITLVGVMIVFRLLHLFV